MKKTFSNSANTKHYNIIYMWKHTLKSQPVFNKHEEYHVISEVRLIVAKIIKNHRYVLMHVAVVVIKTQI